MALKRLWDLFEGFVLVVVLFVGVILSNLYRNPSGLGSNTLSLNNVMLGKEQNVEENRFWKTSGSVFFPFKFSPLWSHSKTFETSMHTLGDSVVRAFHRGNLAALCLLGKLRVKIPTITGWLRFRSFSPLKRVLSRKKRYFCR